MLSDSTLSLHTLITTGDGSHTYLHPEHGASYRSTRGAHTESRHIFLEGTRLRLQPTPWKVLELGFGSGLNFTSAAELAQELKAELHYTSLEPEPMERKLWLIDEHWQNAIWRVPLSIGSITLRLEPNRWQDYKPKENYYSAIFHDPFAPAQNPDCGGVEVFSWAAKALCPEGVLATYGASTAARQNMSAAGLCVGVLPGACGKREMTVAAKQQEAIIFARPWKK